MLKAMLITVLYAIAVCNSAFSQQVYCTSSFSSDKLESRASLYNIGAIELSGCIHLFLSCIKDNILQFNHCTTDENIKITHSSKLFQVKGEYGADDIRYYFIGNYVYVACGRQTAEYDIVKKMITGKCEHDLSTKLIGVYKENNSAHFVYEEIDKMRIVISDFRKTNCDKIISHKHLGKAVISKCIATEDSLFYTIQNRDTGCSLIKSSKRELSAKIASIYKEEVEAFCISGKSVFMGRSNGEAFKIENIDAPELSCKIKLSNNSVADACIIDNNIAYFVRSKVGSPFLIITDDRHNIIYKHTANVHVVSYAAVSSAGVIAFIDTEDNICIIRKK